ncbi:MAG TPA: hypothetical protein VFH76_22050 [Kribbella sp.]|jgi:hypothetical protein|nr:hypothetical protein [Kribbella sp.]
MTRSSTDTEKVPWWALLLRIVIRVIAIAVICVFAVLTVTLLLR